MLASAGRVASLELELKRRGDALLALGFRLQAPAWPRRGAATVDRARRDVAAALLRFSERGWLEDPRAFHREPSSPRNTRLTRSHAAWLPYEKLTFPSGYKTHRGDPGAARYSAYAANRTAHAWLMRDRSPGRPWVVCVHGYGMGVPYVDLISFRARQLNKQFGLNVACLVLPFHGPRARGNGGSSELIGTGVSNMLHCHAQAVWDARRLIAWLRGQGANRIGVHGVSLGGNVAALLAGLEPDLEDVVLGVPATDFTFSFQQAERQQGEMDCSVPDAADSLWSDLREMYRVVSPLSMEAAVPSDRLAIYAGEVDGVVPANGVKHLWRHFGEPEVAWYPGGHLGFLVESKAQSLVRRRMRRLGRSSAVGQRSSQ